MSAPPVIDRRVLEALLDIELPRRNAGDTARLVVVHGRYREGAPTEFTIRFGERQRRVRVSDQTSVLGAVDAWETHAAGGEDGSDAILVITTGVDDHDLGADLRAHALGRRALSVDRAEIVKQRFGAADLDPRIRQEAWLIDALLDAEPSDGWRLHPAGAPWRRSGGSVLTRDAAVHALVSARLDLSGALPGLGDASGHRDLDVDSLLAWSRAPGSTARYAGLAAAERVGIAAWLREKVGDAAAVLLALVEAGKGEDAMALGVVAAILTDSARTPEAALAVGGLFAGVTHDTGELGAFASAVQGTLARWIGEAGPERRGHQTARDRVMAVLDRADELAASAGLGHAVAGHPFLPSGLDARLRAFAAALTDSPQTVGDALNAVMDHRLADLFADRCGVAAMAARLRRWLDAPDPAEIASVSAGVAGQMRDWGWGDRALNVLWGGDPGNDPVLGRAYREIYEAAVTRRSALDEVFASRLRDWTATASAAAPGGALLVESVMDEIVRPLAREGAPLILVLDGMSASVATQLGEELARGGRWLEVSATPGARRGAVSMIPSVTRTSRASLLSGSPTSGGQAAESAGFEAFWKRRRMQAAVFHKADIPGGPGQRLARPLLDALAGDAVVCAVLNTIDDALDHDREGDRTGWRTSDITFLTDLLNAARDYGRPVVLVSDHGHVLERGGRQVTPASGAGSVRWRTGEPGEGEVELAGPRVLEGGGRVVVPWREDIRYLPRRAGYHGGASLAEMTVPVLVLVPSVDLVPKDWSILPPENTVPWWWADQEAPEAPPEATATKPKTRRTTTQKEALFTVGDVAPVAAVPDTLGARVTRSPVYADQRKYLRKAPEGRQVAAVIDALADSGGRLSAAAVGAAAAAAGGRPPRNADLFITALQRLLNVEGYPVLGLIDSGATVTLETALLCEQFGVER
ncbi:BREX-2 system phosphatase PglZ [Actinomadura decatromicini]|uniref:BREX-2 system phosphatase PglZ n=1 Tax=Actinomadura decatromicini TaxID=2604572 RepID=A0A5D3FB58_9ACTN|nr:BREX-2 system phosphatase PglZ [Actinomadura decatromicini]TYK44605.1 BREX-2 system phosphatase PglZ [Actinomadura decatromicini]